MGFRTGDIERRAPALMARTKFQATPLLVEGSLISCSPFNEVIALDPGSSAPKWRYDPKISTEQRPACRKAILFTLMIGLAAVAVWRWRRADGAQPVCPISRDERPGDTWRCGD